MSTLRLLVVEDSENDTALLLRELRRGGFETSARRVATPEAMRVALVEEVWDAVVSDYSPPRFGAPEALALVSECGLEVPFIVVSDEAIEGVAVDSIKRGASDFVAKGNLTRLVPAMRRGLAVAAEQRERRDLDARRGEPRAPTRGEALSGGIAHELNNLLAVISSYSELLIDGLPEGDPRRDDLREIRVAVGRATGLTRRLLALSRRSESEPSVVDLNSAVRDLEWSLRRIVGGEIAFEAALDDDAGHVLIGTGSLDQVLINLVINARDAMPDGGMLRLATARVTLGPDHEAIRAGATPGPYVELTVADDGEGMDAAARARVLESAIRRRSESGGAGLGLSTVWRAVQQCGGHVTVDSEPGRGTTFRVYLPRCAEDAEASGSRGGGET